MSRRLTSEAIRKRNVKIRRCLAEGVKTAELAEEYGLKPGTIKAINSRYKGSGYEDPAADEYHHEARDKEPPKHGHPPPPIEGWRIEYMLEASIDTTGDSAGKALETRRHLQQRLDAMYQIYSDSIPGSSAAELAISEISKVAVALHIAEVKLSAAGRACAVLRRVCSCVAADGNGKAELPPAAEDRLDPLISFAERSE